MLSERFHRGLLVQDYSIEFARFRMRKLPCNRAIKPSTGAACELVHGCIKTHRFSAQAGRGVDGAPWGRELVLYRYGFGLRLLIWWSFSKGN